MSKYIIELKDDIQVVQKVGVTENGNAFVMNFYKDQLEELKLNSDYISEHFGDLQDKAYQRGFEDGKNIREKGCEGCEWEGAPFDACERCCNSYKNMWTAKGDKIEVGDEVNWLGDCFIVTRIFQPRTQKEQCDGIDDDGCVYNGVLMDDLKKTGNHYDISSILKEMQND